MSSLSGSRTGSSSKAGLTGSKISSGIGFMATWQRWQAWKIATKTAVKTTVKTAMNTAAKTAAKTVAMRTIAALLVSVATGCAAPAPKDDGSLEFWTMQLQPQFTDYFTTAIGDFDTQNPTTPIKWVDVPWSAMETKILAAVSANTAPDVVNLNPSFASLLAGREAWLPLDEYVSEEARSVYLPKIWAASRFNGQSFGIPWYLTTRITIANTDLLKQAGVEKIPTTYAELATVARQVKEKTGKYAIFISVVPDDSGELLEAFVQMGMELLTPEGKAAFNSPAGKQAFQYWVDLYKNELLPREALTQGHQRAIELYQAGELAILASGPQFMKSIEQNAPTIAKVSEPATQITGETGKMSVAVMNIVIPKGTDNPEAAVKFALFITSPEQQLAFSKVANTLPSTTATLADPYFKVAEDAPAFDRARAISAQQLEKAEVLIPPVANVKQLQRILYTQLQAAMLGEKSVDEALAAAETEWNALQAQSPTPAATPAATQSSN